MILQPNTRLGSKFHPKSASPSKISKRILKAPASTTYIMKCAMQSKFWGQREWENQVPWVAQRQYLQSVQHHGPSQNASLTQVGMQPLPLFPQHQYCPENYYCPWEKPPTKKSLSTKGLCQGYNCWIFCNHVHEMDATFAQGQIWEFLTCEVVILECTSIVLLIIQ